MFVLNVIGKGANPHAFAELGLGEAAILSPGFAFDLPASGQGVLHAARDLARGTSWDINLVATAHRRKKLLVADMDSTIIANECLNDLAELAGVAEKIAPITEKAMKGEMDFETALVKRVAMLKGVKLDLLEKLWRERVRLNPGARSLVANTRAHGARTDLVSGGFTFFTERVAATAGFDAQHGNVALDDGKALTGEMARPILGRDGKRRVLEETAAQLGISLQDSLAVGDGANDVAMIERAGLGVAYHARPVVAAAASAIIAHNDLMALLYLQGYRDSEIRQAD